MDNRLAQFIVVAESGSFTKAARVLHISQPALSMAIDKLEKELQSTLITRGTRGGLTLTEAGRLTYRTATAKQQLHQDLIENLVRLSNRKPHLALGMIDSVAEQLCLSDELMRLETQTQLSLIVNNSRYLHDAVSQRLVDYAVIVDSGPIESHIKKWPIDAEILILACSRNNQSMYEKEVSQGVLSKFIAYDTPSHTYRYTRESLAKYHIKAKTRINSTSPSIIQDMVRQGRGVGFIPERIINEDDELVPVTNSGLPITCSRPLTIISLKDRELPVELATLFHITKAK